MKNTNLPLLDVDGHTKAYKNWYVSVGRGKDSLFLNKSISPLCMVARTHHRFQVKRKS